ncbi:DsrE family protein [Cytophagaceae bacterium DM2B3-1]|uniref:DsrE family protein n=1 Tax=Xanthocytophaga flava TaxID=3048013 RepID=A0ABT7CRD9_9BACT|nr:DsrE family protein [Xanthocytophaga flavus]MDJ1496287.1 DsrE family protein [Xanthocytophaga flavus]
MKTFFTYLAILLLSAEVSSVVYAQQPTHTMSQKDAQHKVVVQFSTADTLSQGALIKNLNNLLKGLPNVQVEVVFHGPGIDMMLTQSSKYTNLLEDLSKKGVALAVCENTLRSRKLDKTSILSFGQTVPSGVVEVILKQEQGWSYLKGGL